MSNWRLGAAAMAAGVALSQSLAHADVRVGVTGAVNPSAAGTPPGADTRQLTVGSDIQFRERVITTTDGQAQILFLDQSSLLIGPNSTVVIDEFVYDPATNKGNIAATLTQGSFRYIGGKLSKQGNATLKTPVATLGIRGSDITVDYDAGRRLMNVVTIQGLASLTTANDRLNLRGGFGVTVSGSDARLSVPAALTAAQIGAANRQFEGLSGRSAGAGRPPTDGDVARSGLSGAVEAKGLASTASGAGGAPGNSPLQIPFAPGNNDTPQKFAAQQTVGTPQTSEPPPSAPPQAAAPPATRSERAMNGYVAGIAIASDRRADRHRDRDDRGDRHDRDERDFRRDRHSASTTITNDAPSGVLIETVTDTQGTGRVFASLAYRPAPHARFDSAQLQLGDPAGRGAATQSAVAGEASFVATQASGRSAGLAKIDGNSAAAVAGLASVPNGTAVGKVTGEAGAGPACTCSYLTWGLWMATLSEKKTSQTVPHGFWVAGVLPDVNDPSPQGSASFSGTAIGVAESRDSQRLASGAFTNVYNFTQRNGVVSISNFDGKSFGGTVSAGGDWRSYTGALSGSRLTGSLNGSFYGNRAADGQLQVPKETGGNFNVQGWGYKASGVFLGAR